MTKPKIASDWLAACAGCHMSLLDIDERIVEIVQLADIRATPITDLKEPDEDGVDVGILTGAVNTTTNEEVAHRMRDRCKILVSMGDCAVFGGVIAMRNFFELEDALRRAYVETESTWAVPGRARTRFRAAARPRSATVDLIRAIIIPQPSRQIRAVRNRHPTPAAPKDP